MKKFVEAFREMQTSVHLTAIEKGWWEPKDDLKLLQTVVNEDNKLSPVGRERLNNLLSSLQDRNDGELLALIHSELSEGLEGLRHGNPPDNKIPEYSAMEAEYADVIIRIMDHAERRGWDIAGAIVAKAEMNKTRSHRHGSKAF
jgi:NTP pyrophosphatase (non-canonical NTP hydrolase)